jgi:hypothetical protein
MVVIATSQNCVAISGTILLSQTWRQRQDNVLRIQQGNIVVELDIDDAADLIARLQRWIECKR